MHARGRRFFCILLVLLLAAFPIEAVSAAAGEPESSIVYFYVKPCPTCEKVSEFLDSLGTLAEAGGMGASAVPVIYKIDYSDRENNKLAAKYFLTYRVPPSEQAAPIVFIGDTYLSGEQDILSRLLGLVESGYGLGTIKPDDITMPESIQQPKEAEGLSGSWAAGAMAAGLICGISSCPLSILSCFFAVCLAFALFFLVM